MERDFEGELALIFEKLTSKQQKFVDHYVQYGNAVEAYRKAGYHGKNDNSQVASASQILSSLNVAQYVKTYREKKAHDNSITMDKIILETAKIAFGSGLEAVVTHNAGEIVLNEAPDFTLLDSVSSSSSYSEGQGGSTSSKSFSVKRKDRLKALDMLAKMLGGYNAKPGTSSGDEGATAKRILDALGAIRKKQ